MSNLFLVMITSIFLMTQLILFKNTSILRRIIQVEFNGICLDTILVSGLDRDSMYIYIVVFGHIKYENMELKPHEIACIKLNFFLQFTFLYLIYSLGGYNRNKTRPRRPENMHYVKNTYSTL